MEKGVNSLWRYLLRLILGKSSEEPDVLFFETAKIKISARKKIKFVVDGEIVETATAEIESVPGGLRTLVPAASATSEP